MIDRTKTLLPLIGLVLLLAACGGNSSANQDTDLTIEQVPAETPVPVPSPVPAPSAADLRGFIWPIASGCLPQGDQLMPNAPREYRLGVHEGVDFYQVDNCTRIQRGTEVLAAKDGIVRRADLDYRDLDANSLAAIMANPTAEASLDAFRGRQVWVEHANGIVTRYCHLSGVAPGITPGTLVKAGQLIAFVGESGTPQSVSSPGSEMHLHWELRIGDSYLGKGLPKDEVRRLYREAFTAP